MSKIRLHGSSSGYTEIAPVAASGNNTLTLPNDGTIISKDAAGAVGVTSVVTDTIKVGAAVTISESGVDVVGVGSFSGNIVSGGEIQAATRFESKSGNDLRLNAGSVNRDVFLQVNDTTLCTVQGSTGNLQFNSGYGSVANAYGVRAWANFNGSGTVSDGNGGNVSSLVDLGEGTYRVNFSTAMPDTNYCMIAGSSNGATSVRTNCQQTKTTALYEWKTNDHGANTYDAANCQIAFIR